MTRQCVQTLSEHKAAVTSVLCWDEKLLSCSLDKTVKVWTRSESGNLQVKYTHDEEHVSTTPAAHALFLFCWMRILYANSIATTFCRRN